MAKYTRRARRDCARLLGLVNVLASLAFSCVPNVSAQVGTLRIDGSVERASGFVPSVSYEVFYGNDGLVQKVQKFTIDGQQKKSLIERADITKSGNVISEIVQRVSGPGNALQEAFRRTIEIADDQLNITIEQGGKVEREIVREIDTGQYELVQGEVPIVSFSLRSSDLWFKDELQGTKGTAEYADGILSKVNVSHTSGPWKGVTGFWTISERQDGLVFQSSPGPAGQAIYHITVGGQFPKNVISGKALSNLVLCQPLIDPTIFLSVLTAKF